MQVKQRQTPQHFKMVQDLLHKVSSTLLPSTVVCYTSGIVNGSGGLPVDGYYRDAATGNLYKSDYVWDLTGNPSVSGYADIGSFSSSKSGAFTSFGYGSSQNHIRIDDASGYVKCEWVRDYLPDHLDSNSTVFALKCGAITAHGRQATTLDW